MMEENEEATPLEMSVAANQESAGSRRISSTGPKIQVQVVQTQTENRGIQTK